MILVCVAIVVLVFLGLRAGFLAMRPDSDPVFGGPIDDSVVALSDGSVIIARPGTISRALIDWFNNPAAPPKTFDVGWAPFEPRSAEPAPESAVRLQRFAVEMRANPDVKAKVIVCTASNDKKAIRLSKLRAARLEELLVASQIDASQISANTCRLRDSKNVPNFQSAQDGEIIGIALSRRD